MSWIKKIGYEQSAGKLRRLYDRIKGKDGYIDNILTIHGQRPHSLEGHLALYKNVLHHSSNRTPKWVLEMLGLFASMLNHCRYCTDHHYEGMRVLLRDEGRANAIRNALETGKLDEIFSPRERAMLQYAQKLTLQPGSMEEADVLALKEQGLEEGEILEVNQVVSYFAYANRTILGLGVTTEGDILGLSPSDSDDPDNWRHQEAKP